MKNQEGRTWDSPATSQQRERGAEEENSIVLARQNAVDRVTCEIPHPTDLTFLFHLLPPRSLTVTRWYHGGALHEREHLF